jgi:hypothetical protein
MGTQDSAFLIQLTLYSLHGLRVMAIAGSIWSMSAVCIFMSAVSSLLIPSMILFLWPLNVFLLLPVLYAWDSTVGIVTYC